MRGRYRPNCPILAISRDEHISAALHLHRGLHPFTYTEPKKDDDEVRVDAARRLINYSPAIHFAPVGCESTTRADAVQRFIHGSHPSATNSRRVGY